MPSILNATTTNGLVTSADNSGSLQLQTNNGTTAVTIDTSQNVGIGTNSPSNPLAIYRGSGVASFIDLIGNGNTAGTSNVVIGQNADDGGYFWNRKASFLSLGTSNTERMRIDSSGNVGIGTSSPTVSGSTATTLYLKGISGNQALLSVASNDAASSVQFWSGNGSTDNPAIAYQKNLRFGSATDAGVGGFTERMRITSGGDLLVGTTTSDIWVSSATNTGFRVEPNGTTTVARSGFAALLVKRTNASTGDLVSFGYGTSVVGTISTNGTGVTYGTSSDYRLKENIAPMTGALAKVAQLKPCTYTWKVDGSAGQGFIAHELQEVVPDCVSGEKDGVETYIDEEGNEQTRPVYQGVDTSFLVATLTAAIQELKAELDATKAEVQALKGVA